jgi:hypothetical protein
VAEFGAESNSGRDETAAIQAAIHAVESVGGGTVIIPGRYICGNLVVSGENVRLEGRRGWLVDGRLTIATESRNVEVANLALIDTRGDPRTYLIDVSGCECRFSNIAVIKDPITAGYQIYLRQSATGCHFDGLQLRGANGIFVAGIDHVFENFEFESKDLRKPSGDDAFAIKGAEEATRNISIRNGIVRGFAAIVSFGSEIGTREPGARAGSVRNVTVENVIGDRCNAVAFFKPGALGSDWREGLVERIRLRNLTLVDPAGAYFRVGIRMWAGRGARIRDVAARGINIVARAMDHDVMPTAAIEIVLADKGAPASMENINLQMNFTDPYAGAPHSPEALGYPIDYIVRIEKRDSRKGSMSGVVLDVDGRGSVRGGIYVGAGLDDAIRIRRAVLTRVAMAPPSNRGGGGLWSSSRISLGKLTIDSAKLPDFGGPAFATRR